jgi:hypothetical protein
MSTREQDVENELNVPTEHGHTEAPAPATS